MEKVGEPGLGLSAPDVLRIAKEKASMRVIFAPLEAIVRDHVAMSPFANRSCLMDNVWAYERWPETPGVTTDLYYEVLRDRVRLESLQNSLAGKKFGEDEQWWSHCRGDSRVNKLPGKEYPSTA